MQDIKFNEWASHAVFATISVNISANFNFPIPAKMLLAWAEKEGIADLTVDKVVYRYATQVALPRSPEQLQVSAIRY